MKKNKKIIFLAIIVLIVIIIAIIINNNKSSNVHMLMNLYNDLNESQTYVFTEQKDSKNKTIIAKDGERTAIDSYTSGTHTTTIVENGTTTYILHDREEYYIYQQNNVEQGILTDWIKETVEKEYTNGKEKVRGKTYSYEEYSGGTMFMETTSLYINEEDIKTRFYFDKEGNLVYIKSIYGENDEELLEIDLTKEVNNSLFEIPANYAEN